MYIQDLTDNQLTTQYTAFKSFHELLHAKGNYRPSLRTETTRGREQFDLRVLADSYDLEQLKRGDSRRAFRS